MDSAEFYDRMANEYHLISSNWYSVCESQGQLLHKLLQNTLSLPGPFRILDCSCGTGTQALGLAKLGHDVTGTDISAAAISRAKQEAMKLGVAPELKVADMRTLDGVSGPFDAVLSFDNSVAHLTTVADLAFAFSSILHVLRPGGFFLMSLRDYDRLKQERPTGNMPRRIVDSYGERVYVQTWDWSEDGKTYDLRLFVLKPNGESWVSRPLITKMRAYTRSEIVEEAEKTGFVSCRWLTPEQTGYYQPILVAKKA